MHTAHAATNAGLPPIRTPTNEEEKKNKHEEETIARRANQPTSRARQRSHAHADIKKLRLI